MKAATLIAHLSRTILAWLSLCRDLFFCLSLSLFGPLGVWTAGMFLLLPIFSLIEENSESQLTSWFGFYVALPTLLLLSFLLPIYVIAWYLGIAKRWGITKPQQEKGQVTETTTETVTEKEKEKVTESLKPDNQTTEDITIKDIILAEDENDREEYERQLRVLLKEKLREIITNKESPKDTSESTSSDKPASPQQEQDSSPQINDEKEKKEEALNEDSDGDSENDDGENDDVDPPQLKNVLSTTSTQQQPFVGRLDIVTLLLAITTFILVFCLPVWPEGTKNREIYQQILAAMRGVNLTSFVIFIGGIWSALLFGERYQRVYIWRFASSDAVLISNLLIQAAFFLLPVVLWELAVNDDGLLPAGMTVPSPTPVVLPDPIITAIVRPEDFDDPLFLDI